ncbi:MULTISPECIES: response regulator transcription factor [unclassified Pseudofrankia]|uniref:response regulator transcription factor n=1 Tax=unclassified Pseudofrankia TaxID=2994372 RepID=UPI0008DA5C5A|nr:MULTISPECIES: response regulator transcription factor [unclassified Pseudofrankia]MDT3441106.1 response regulator transcription factor [Pseudofrankia sp. BMG5.37]OHV54281.1 two-component system response regulator [Pseudofrankia sp. BMG5.36]
MRLLIVEDDDRVAAALSSVLGRHGFDIVRARTAARALDLMHTRPDLVLLDLGLPDRDGFDVCGRIRKVSNTPVIMVTARAELSARIHGLYLGADDYIVKPYDLRELIARIHAVVRRSRPDPLAPADVDTTGHVGGTATRPDGQATGGAGSTGAVVGTGAAEVGRVVETRGLRVHLDSREVTGNDGRTVALTRKEFDLLAELARAPGVVFRREQLISEVWGSSVQSASRTLEVHVASLRAKLGDPCVVQTVRGVGYRLAAAGAPAPPPAEVARAGTGAAVAAVEQDTDGPELAAAAAVKRRRRA